jgi:hypothetical protein
MGLFPETPLFFILFQPQIQKEFKEKSKKHLQDKNSLLN